MTLMTMMTLFELIKITLMAAIALKALVTLFKVGNKAIREGGGGVGSLVQKLKAGAAAEARGEQNPGLVNNNNNNSSNNSNMKSSSNNNNTEEKGKKINLKALLKKKHQKNHEFILGDGT